MFRLFLLLICMLPWRATAATGGQAPEWNWHDAGTKSLRIGSALPEVTLEAGAKGAFVDNRAYQIGKKRFRVLYQVFDSNAGNPMERCGAGREIHLFVYEVTSPTPVERGRILIWSCLHNVSLASQNSGRPGSESDFPRSSGAEMDSRFNGGTVAVQAGQKAGMYFAMAALLQIDRVQEIVERGQNRSARDCRDRVIDFCAASIMMSCNPLIHLQPNRR